MAKTPSGPIQPILNGTALAVACRPLLEVDLPILAALAAACLREDGGLPLIATEAFLQEQLFWKSPQRRSIGVFANSSLLIGYSLVTPERALDPFRVTAHGLVHPAYRRQGLGAALADWTTSAVADLLAEEDEESGLLRVVNETLTDAAVRFYTTRGLTQTFEERILRFDLQQALPPANLPAGLSIENWSDGRAPAFFQAYQSSFAERPGFPNWSQEYWIEWIAGDPDFSPRHSFLVCQETAPVAFIACAENYITQVGVHPHWRRRGIASALLCRSLAGLRADGFNEALLMVNDNNPTAIAAYLQFGFQQIGRRGRFERPLASAI